MLKGIDVAKWNGTINWNKAKKDGVKFAILKVINKSNSKEDSFERNYSGCYDQQIPVGVYNYLYATTITQGIMSAKAVVNAIDGKDIPLKVWIDVEDNCLKGMGQKLIDILKEYISVIKAAGYQCGIYTGLSFYNTYIKKYASQLNCEFWIARYPSSTKMKLSADPSSTKKPSITNKLWGWQYSSKGQISGITGDVDLDVMYAIIEEKGDTYQATSTTIYFPKYTGAQTSIAPALKEMGIDSSFSYRTQIAKANGITNYIGTAKQNTTMLTLLKKGTLERP